LISTTPANKHLAVCADDTHVANSLSLIVFSTTNIGQCPEQDAYSQPIKMTVGSVVSLVEGSGQSPSRNWNWCHFNWKIWALWHHFGQIMKKIGPVILYRGLDKWRAFANEGLNTGPRILHILHTVKGELVSRV